MSKIEPGQRVYLTIHEVYGKVLSFHIDDRFALVRVDPNPNFNKRDFYVPVNQLELDVLGELAR